MIRIECMPDGRLHGIVIGGTLNDWVHHLMFVPTVDGSNDM